MPHRVESKVTNFQEIDEWQAQWMSEAYSGAKGQ
jgi:hypothetical protein